MMAAILICGLTITSVSLSSCEKANAQEDSGYKVDGKSKDWSAH